MHPHGGRVRSHHIWIISLLVCALLHRVTAERSVVHIIARKSAPRIEPSARALPIEEIRPYPGGVLWMVCWRRKTSRRRRRRRSGSG